MSWRRRLDALRASTGSTQSRRAWDALVADAHASALAVAGTTAMGQSLSSQPLPARDAFFLGLDALVDTRVTTATGFVVDARPLQEGLLEALHRYGSNKWAGYSAKEVHDALVDMAPERVDKLMNGVQGTLLELRVAESFADGTFPMPDDLGGAVSGIIADRNAHALDGWLFNDAHEVVDSFQVKATDSLADIRQHLRDHADVETVFTTSTAAERASEAGLETVHDSGYELDDFMPGDREAFIAEFDGWAPPEWLATSMEWADPVADALPLITAAVMGAELAVRRMRGDPVHGTLRDIAPRAGRASAISVAGWGVATATGVGAGRLVVTVGALAGGRALHRVDEELASSVHNIRHLRQQLQVRTASAASD